MFELGKEAQIEHQNIAQLAISLNIQNVILVGENFYRTEIESEILKKYKNFDSLEMHFKISEVKDSTLLIKGSRGMALERILTE